MIKNSTKGFSVFVGNRLSLIEEVGDLNQWRFVDDASNPADDTLHGLSAYKLDSK